MDEPLPGEELDLPANGWPKRRDEASLAPTAEPRRRKGRQ